MAKTTHAGVELVLLNPPICPNLPQMCVYTYALTHSYMYLFFSTFMVTIFLYISSLFLQHLNNLISISKTSSTCLEPNLPHYCPSLVFPAPKRWQDGDGHPRNHDPTSACLIAFLYLTLTTMVLKIHFFFTPFLFNLFLVWSFNAKISKTQIEKLLIPFKNSHIFLNGHFSICLSLLIFFIKEIYLFFSQS